MHEQSLIANACVWHIGQDKEVVGYYKRVSIVKIGETYEDMLELHDIEKQGYLVANDDGTAFFELNSY